MTKIEIRDEFIKLDSLLKFANVVSSGGEAKNIIADSLVTFNNDICTMRGKKCRKGDVIKVLEPYNESIEII